jgi:hypothetical protein
MEIRALVIRNSYSSTNEKLYELKLIIKSACGMCDLIVSSLFNTFRCMVLQRSQS